MLSRVSSAALVLLGLGGECSSVCAENSSSDAVQHFQPVPSKSLTWMTTDQVLRCAVQLPCGCCAAALWMLQSFGWTHLNSQLHAIISAHREGH